MTMRILIVPQRGQTNEPRATPWGWSSDFPGRCPGLICFGPFRAMPELRNDNQGKRLDLPQEV